MASFADFRPSEINLSVDPWQLVGERRDLPNKAKERMAAIEAADPGSETGRNLKALLTAEIPLGDEKTQNFNRFCLGMLALKEGDLRGALSALKESSYLEGWYLAAQLRFKLLDSGEGDLQSAEVAWILQAPGKIEKIYDDVQCLLCLEVALHSPESMPEMKRKLLTAGYERLGNLYARIEQQMPDPDKEKALKIITDVYLVDLKNRTRTPDRWDDDRKYFLYYLGMAPQGLRDRLDQQGAILPLLMDMAKGLLRNTANPDKHDYATVASYLSEAATRYNHAEAKYLLGLLHFGGCGVPRDVKKAVEGVRQAAEGGHRPAARFIDSYDRHHDLEESIATATVAGTDATFDKHMEELVVATGTWKGRAVSWLKNNFGNMLGAAFGAALLGGAITGIVFLTIAFPYVMIPIEVVVGLGMLAFGAVALGAAGSGALH